MMAAFQALLTSLSLHSCLSLCVKVRKKEWERLKIQKQPLYYLLNLSHMVPLCDNHT